MRTFEILNHDILRRLDGFKFGIWGGAARAQFFNKTPRDVDVAVDCTKEDLVGLFPKADLNRFGGLKVKGEITFDMWPLSSTWNIKQAKVEPTFENLASLGPYNADCIILHSSKYFIDRGFYKSMNTRQLEVNYAHNPHHAHNVLRGFRLLENLKMVPGASFIEYARQNALWLDSEMDRYEKFYGLTVNRPLVESVLKGN